MRRGPDKGGWRGTGRGARVQITTKTNPAGWAETQEGAKCGSGGQRRCWGRAPRGLSGGRRRHRGQAVGGGSARRRRRRDQATGGGDKESLGESGGALGGWFSGGALGGNEETLGTLGSLEEMLGSSEGTLGNSEELGSSLGAKNPLTGPEGSLTGNRPRHQPRPLLARCQAAAWKPITMGTGADLDFTFDV
ncbi:uncharacterized PE-PGRS family protein PE_PGRS54-like [Xiphophorus hellerii]|uniref:uncharacterized PE-PGRS family protein PE_PGRS54-like n=1 Tax=Xiphophorus hellerii TaxID=8084 RepID=UPI0013B3D8D1|nr:uncharacterized PE-PGRS family protein PE_PGRS54-like [Xiphophorus hellerii]